MKPTVCTIADCGRNHRVTWELANGPVPDGLHLDHLCRVRACCNPKHLEPVTNRENWLRGEHYAAVAVRENRCRRGHDLIDDSVHVRANGTRYCKVCAQIATDRRRERRSA